MLKTIFGASMLVLAASGRWREPVAALLDGKGTGRAARLAARIRDGRLERSTEEESVS